MAGGYGKPPCPLYLPVSFDSFPYLVDRVVLSPFAWLGIGYKIEDVDWVSRTTTIIHKPNGLLDHSCELKRLFWLISAHFLSPPRNAHRDPSPADEATHPNSMQQLSRKGVQFIQPAFFVVHFPVLLSVAGWNKIGRYRVGVHGGS
jgi:hypothetical protein